MKIDTTRTCTLTHRYNMLCIFVRSSQWRAPRYIYPCKPSNHPKNCHGNNRYSVFSALHSFHCLALSHFRGMSNIYKHKFFINFVCVETLISWSCHTIIVWTVFVFWGSKIPEFTKVSPLSDWKGFQYVSKVGGILVFWESWRNHVVNWEEMILCKILGLNVKLKNDKSKSSPIMTVKWEEQVLKCDKGEARSSR